LVYLAYFNEIRFESHYEGDKRRVFSFTADFNGNSKKEAAEGPPGTKSVFHLFSGESVYSYGYLVPDRIKESLIKQFFPRLFNKKTAQESLKITISLNVEEPNPDKDFVTSKAVLTLNDLPELKGCRLQDQSLDFFQAIDVRYSVRRDLTQPKSVRTSISVDGRAIDWDLVPVDAVPTGYQVIFLFSSDYFTGKTNTSRQRLQLPDEVTERALKGTLRREVGRIMAKEIPQISAENEKVESRLNEKYPHLAGLYPTDAPGLLVPAIALEEAQKRFFAEQKKLLECETLDEGRYEKALEHSARALMEYVLYRARIIAKLKTMNPTQGEGAIHNLIVPMRRRLEEDNFDEDVYNNNVWMLDDKYMSYNTVLSDRSMSEVAKFIALDDIDDTGRSDITIVFSASPFAEGKVSVVVVELKKQGVKLAKKEEVVSQLRQRARKLLNYFPDKIERIWFYGVTEIDKEFRRSLKEDQFKELFSHGQVFYKQQPILGEDEKTELLVDLFVMTYDAFIHDAQSRNETFVRILRARIASFLKDRKGPAEPMEAMI
jgi:hypothetical protein